MELNLAYNNNFLKRRAADFKCSERQIRRRERLVGFIRSGDRILSGP